MTRTPSMSAAVRRALDERWPFVRAASRAHFAVIEEFVLAGNTSTPPQRTAAFSAAHKLSGSLGMFGRRDASAVASAIEDLLATGAATSELRTLVERLDGLISLDDPSAE